MRTLSNKRLYTLQTLSAAECEEVRQPAVELTLHLRVITPIVGGGARAMEPDERHPLRLSAVRGQLRQWARYTDPQPPDLEREAALWGGVVGQEAHASRVLLSVEVQNPGKIIPAGAHPLKNGRYASLPQWQGPASGLGYVLFPLQATRDELKQGSRSLAFPTKSIRVGLSFTLRVRILPPPAKAAPGQDDAKQAEQVLRALWAWIHLGGVGARTRRGLGALAVDEVSIRGAWALLDSKRWEGWLCVKDRAQWRKAAREVLDGGWRTGGARLLLSKSPAQDTARAHQHLVKLLQQYRQLPPGGRAQGQGGGAGKSNWPEADVVRTVTNHPKPKSRTLRNLQFKQSRAALGLPLEMQFLNEKTLNGTLRLKAHGRYASPVLLRPVEIDRKAYGVVLMLPHDRAVLEHGPLMYQNGKAETIENEPAPPEAYGPPLRGWLSRKGWDAVRALEASLPNDLFEGIDLQPPPKEK